MSELYQDPGFRLDPITPPTHPAIKVLAGLMGIAFFVIFGLPSINSIIAPPRPHDVPSNVSHGPHPYGSPQREMDHQAFHHARPPA